KMFHPARQLRYHPRLPGTRPRLRNVLPRHFPGSALLRHGTCNSLASSRCGLACRGPSMSGSRTIHSANWLHPLAVLTACVALLPILVGAVVTTKDAGMAFRDWPSSDGYHMFLYPWLESAGNKFMEHGHRLGGIVIGLSSMA